MTTTNLVLEKITLKPKFLWFFMMAYSVTIFAANWFDPRLIKIFGLNTGAGSIAFPITYLLADTMTEVYGYKNTRLAIWFGLLFYSITILYGQFVVYFSLKNSELNLFLHINRQIIIATSLSLLVAESINSYLVAKLKISFQGKFIGLRFLIATLSAHFFNELFYAPIAFYGLMDLKNFIQHMLDSWIFMVSLELLLLPFFIKIAKHLKTIEETDIYDQSTQFNLFNLNTCYKKGDNHYKDCK